MPVLGQEGEPPHAPENEHGHGQEQEQMPIHLGNDDQLAADLSLPGRDPPDDEALQMPDLDLSIGSWHVIQQIDEPPAD